MSENSKIEWTDHTFNPWIGCARVSPGCDNCYAAVSTPARVKGIKWGAGEPRLRTADSSWKQPKTWNARHDAFFAEHGRRQRVFCASLADVFDNEVDNNLRNELFGLIYDTPNLDWLLLTKRIGNVPRLMEECTEPGKQWELPPNVWLGATIVNQEEADRDIPKLLGMPAAVRFLSMEPLLGAVTIWKYTETHCERHPGKLDSDDKCEVCEGRGIWGLGGDELTEDEKAPIRSGIDWVIVGGESGPGARPMHPDWARSLREECAAAGVPFLFKQWGEWKPTSSADYARDSKAEYHAAFREKHGRGGFEFPGREGRAILRDGRTCVIDPAGGNEHHRPRSQIADAGAYADFHLFNGGKAPDPGYQWMYNAGKRAAGRELDGVTHDGFPGKRHV